MFTPETGGARNKVFHFYAYKDLSERETVRQDMVDRDKWLRFLDKSRPHMLGPAVRVHAVDTAPWERTQPQAAIPGRLQREHVALSAHSSIIAAWTRT